MDGLVKQGGTYLQQQIPTLVGFCLKVLISLLVFYVGMRAIRWLLKFLRRSMEQMKVDRGIIQFTCSLVKILLYLLLVFQIATQFGVTEASVAALIGSTGITLAMGLQGGLSNLAGGVMLLLFKPFQVGDYIVYNNGLAGCEGTVSRIDMCYTRLATIDNKIIVIPNGTLSNSSITNVTETGERRLDVKVGISYQSDIRQAKGILEKLLRQEPDIYQDRELAVFVDELADSAVILGFRAWVSTEKYWEVKWDLNEKIKLAFDRDGIQIPYNQLDVHLYSSNCAESKNASPVNVKILKKGEATHDLM